MGEVGIAEKPKGDAKVEVRADAFKPYDNPSTAHQRFVNKLFEARLEILDDKKSIPDHDERAHFASMINTLAAEEKTMVVDRDTFLMERGLVKVLDSQIQALGAEKTNQAIDKYLDVRIPKYTEMVTLKRHGWVEKFTSVVKGAITEAVEEQAASMAKEKAVVGKEQAAIVPPPEEVKSDAKLASSQEAVPSP